MIRKNENNIVSVSWADHLTFGEGDGKLANHSALHRRIEKWRDNLGASIIHWRMLKTKIPGHFGAAKDKLHPTLKVSRDLTWDDFVTVPQFSHKCGLKAYLYVSIFDEGWRLMSKDVRNISYHNEMHGQHVSWQSSFGRNHPDYFVVDRSGTIRQEGVLCLAYPEVREHLCHRFISLLSGYEFDGLFVCLRSQSRPAEFADHYGFNEPIRLDYLNRYGKNICEEDFDLPCWRELLGEYLTIFISKLSDALRSMKIRLAIGIPRGDVLGPPLGNTALQWREWIKRGLVDEFIINQNSSQCPSMWHQLWPMHRGYGYLQNYLDGYNMPSLHEQLEHSYSELISKSKVELYVARQWDERSEEEDNSLLKYPFVSGLVFSSFRYDNPGLLKQADWRA